MIHHVKTFVMKQVVSTLWGLSNFGRKISQQKKLAILKKILSLTIHTKCTVPKCPSIPILHTQEH